MFFKQIILSKGEIFVKKNKKIENKSSEESKTKSKKSSLIWLGVVAIIAVGLLVFCQLYFGDPINSETTFYQNTSVNGIDISGLTKEEASQVVSSALIKDMANTKITLQSGDQTWSLSGEDFEYVGNIENTLASTMEVGRSGNIFEKKKMEKQIKNEGLVVTLPYSSLFGGMEEKVNEICLEVESKASTPQIKFNPQSANMFTIDSGAVGYVVNRDQLSSAIDKAIADKSQEIIEIPLVEVVPNTDSESLLKQIGKRSEFSTSYATSSTKRKNNIKKALASFNGMTVLPGETISFNKTTGPRTKANGYENANIIIDGNYVSGTGGGVCQASTTLYNALLLADMEVITAFHHSLPASYVPLSFDAMVSEGYADLVFKNSSDCPIFIKTICDENNAKVEIYGKNFEKGEKIKLRSEVVKILPHDGDKIIPDTDGKYSNHVLYKGEYFRLKYPKQGYESKGYLDYYKDGKLVESKEIRHDHYQPQMGIIIEGTEPLGEGMTLPANGVKYIPPQKIV